MLFLNRKASSGAVWLIVGLGNPGTEYEHTRHNAGFMALDALAEDLNVPVQRLKFRALTQQATIAGERALLMKPVTYMNLSGEAVKEAATFYKVSPDHILVLSDEVALPPGKLRVRPSGSAGGHNGLKSIIACLGTDQFPRIRLGVGQKPHPDYDMADWVIGKFPAQDYTLVEDAAKRAAKAVISVIQEGVPAAMNRYN